MAKKEFLPQGEDSDERDLATYQARQAVTLGRMRYLLGISVLLVVIMFALILFNAL
jgi:hypothetical protein